MKQRSSSWGVMVAALALGLGAGTARASGGFTLDEALARSLEKHPELEAVSAQLRGKEAAALQADLWPNPEVGLEFEELGASGGVDSAQTTMSVNQLLELGGKRAKRREAASLEAGLVRWDLEARRLDLAEKVSSAFVQALAAQKRVALQDELVGLAEKTFETVGERVKAGKVPPIEETRAQVALASTRIGLRKARAGWEGSRRALAALWGGGSEVEAVEGELGLLEIAADPAAPPAANPDLARWKDEIAQRGAVVEREEANRIPDVTLTGGVRAYGAADEMTYLAAVSIPLPLFNRNQWAMAQARQEALRAREEQRATERRLRAELATAYQTFASAQTEARTLRDEVLPDAEAVYRTIQEGYLFGKFEYLALLDAQRTLVESRARLVDALETLHLAQTRLDRVTGARPTGVRQGSSKIENTRGGER